jgi:hypothetical protein
MKQATVVSKDFLIFKNTVAIDILLLKLRVVSVSLIHFKVARTKLASLFIVPLDYFQPPVHLG